MLSPRLLVVQASSDARLYVTIPCVRLFSYDGSVVDEEPTNQLFRPMWT